MIQQKKISQQIAESKTESTYLPKVKTNAYAAELQAIGH